MDRWVLRQLCAHVVHELRGHIPAGWLPGITSPAWGQRAYQIGSVLNQMRPPADFGLSLAEGWHMAMNARQTAAAEVLMHLGIQDAAQKVLDKAPPGYEGHPVPYLTESLVTLEGNTRDALRQYLAHIPEAEARPFLPLLEEVSEEAPDAPAESVQGQKATADKAPTSGTEWIPIARGMAREIIERDAGRDLFPSQMEIAEEIAGKLREQGRPLAIETVKRHALKGMVSGAAELRKLPKHRGKLGNETGANSLPCKS